MIALTLALAIQAEPTYFAAWTGNKLYEACEASRDICIAYVIGINDGMVAQAGSKRDPVPYCLPRQVTFGQMADVVHKFLRENPERRDLGANFLTRDAFVRAFPCK